MVLQHSSPDSLQIKMNQTVVTIKHDGAIKIGDRALEGPGEYDIAGIGAHAFTGHASLFAEGVRLTVVWGDPASLKEDEDAGSDVFIFTLPDANKIEAVIKEQDPRIVVLHDEAISGQLAQGAGVEVQTVSNYKITTQTLPAENREIVLLA